MNANGLLHQLDRTTEREPMLPVGAALAVAPQVRLEVVFSCAREQVGETAIVDRNEAALIGRCASVDLRLHDPRVSRAHVRVVWDPRSCAHRFADLESANGTRLNGVRSAGGLLAENDVLRVGDTLIVCHSHENTARLSRQMALAARSDLPTLILGETGVGKEVYARRLHVDSRRSGKLVAINCATLSRELATAELFGHTRAAFSGAGEARPGLFMTAHGGTLFLDEIADLPFELQGALLRTLQERTVRPVGSDRDCEVNVRVIAATNADIEACVRTGRFREDLLARLNHLVLLIPPLRARKATVLSLLHEFSPELSLSADAAEALLCWKWPRNVRELRATAGALALRHSDLRPLGLSELADAMPQIVAVCDELGSTQSSSAFFSDRRVKLASLLVKHSGNVAAVARELGKPRSHVYRWMRNYGLGSAR